jgi:hypothetical protein
MPLNQPAPMAVRSATGLKAVRRPTPWSGQRHGLARTADTALPADPASLPLPPLVS